MYVGNYVCCIRTTIPQSHNLKISALKSHLQPVKPASTPGREGVVGSVHTLASSPLSRALELAVDSRLRKMLAGWLELVHYQNDDDINCWFFNLRSNGKAVGVCQGCRPNLSVNWSHSRGPRIDDVETDRGASSSSELSVNFLAHVSLEGPHAVRWVAEHTSAWGKCHLPSCPIFAISDTHNQSPWCILY